MVGKTQSFIIALIMLALTGCSTTGEYHVRQGGVMVKVAELKLNKPGALKVEHNGIKMEMDTREPNIWERNIVPVFNGAMKNTQANV